MNLSISAPLVVTLALTSLTLPAQKNQKKGLTFTDPKVATAKDPDFRLQGEYAKEKRGVQLVALGDGKFRMKEYAGGLPGLGWQRDKPPAARDVTTAEAQKLLGEGFQSVTRASTTLGKAPPMGSKILFQGTKECLQNWKKGARISPTGDLMAGATSVPTFGDALVHVEFRLPYKPFARGQGRGNSGLYLQGRYETQMLDSFGLEGKHNECGGIYSVRAPDLNACLPPLRWQTYDIEFRAARFDAAGKKTANAKMTVRLNGIVIHRDVEVPKRTTASPQKESAAPGPIYLQNHGNPVVYRNVWVLPR